jgi:hypothetical protein
VSLGWPGGDSRFQFGRRVTIERVAMILTSNAERGTPARPEKVMI